jgi:hypothetical protein
MNTVWGQKSLMHSLLQNKNRQKAIIMVPSMMRKAIYPTANCTKNTAIAVHTAMAISRDLASMVKPTLVGLHG